MTSRFSGDTGQTLLRSSTDETAPLLLFLTMLFLKCSVVPRGFACKFPLAQPVSVCLKHESVRLCKLKNGPLDM